MFYFLIKKYQFVKNCLIKILFLHKKNEKKSAAEKSLGSNSPLLRQKLKFAILKFKQKNLISLRLYIKNIKLINNFHFNFIIFFQNMGIKYLKNNS